MMNCFPCFEKSEKNDQNINDVPVAQPKYPRTPTPQPRVFENYDANNVVTSDIEARSFTFRELATATKNFRHECSLGECIFGRIYKGTLQPDGEVVSVKRLDKNRIHGNKEFLLEVYMLSLLSHSNLHNLLGYCADGDQRLLVYEFMPMGTLEEHLLDQDAEKKSLDWLTRMKIACGIAEGIEYLHEKANPIIIYRDLKCSNIMLDEEFNPKLSDYGLAKLGANNMSNVTVMGTHGYCAPEYQKHGELTVKSDVYNFGVVLLELISGRRALDTSKPADEQNLVTWAQPIFRNPKRFPEMADPRLGNSYPEKSLNQAVGIVAMCLQDEPDVRPLISDVVASLAFLAIVQPEKPVASPDDHPGRPPETKASPDDHHVRWTPELKAQTSQESCHDETDHSEESSEASWSDYEESFNKNHYERQNDGMDEKSDSDIESESSELSSHVEEKIQQEKQKSVKYTSSWGHMDSLEYEVASMSSSSSNSDNESPLGSIDKRHNNQQSQHGNSSSRMKCESTKIPKEERRDGIRAGSRRSSRKRGGPLGWKGRNDMVSKNDNVGSYSRKSSNEGSDNGLIYGKNHSISSNSSQSSIEGSENGSVRSGHHKDDEGLEDVLL